VFCVCSFVSVNGCFSFRVVRLQSDGAAGLLMFFVDRFKYEGINMSICRINERERESEREANYIIDVSVRHTVKRTTE